MIFFFSAISLSITIAQRGSKTDYVILYQNNSHVAYKHAADLFAEYIFRLTEVNVTVSVDENYNDLPSHSILIGETKFTPKILPDYNIVKSRLVSRDSFHIEIVGSVLVIYGGIQGCNYGVLEILEEYFGVHWFRNDFFVISRLNELKLDLPNYNEQIPKFKLRSSSSQDGFKGSFLQFTMRENFMSGKPDEYGESVTFACCKAVHSLDVYFPPKDYFESHPDWYALRDGVRRPYQLCLTNNEVIEEMKKKLRISVLWTPQPTNRYVFDIGQFDNNAYCQCDRCKAKDEEFGSPAGTFIWFLNQMCELLEKEYPERPDYRIETLSYGYTSNPPKYGSIVPHRNLIIRFAPIGMSTVQPFNDTANKDKITYKQLMEWKKILTDAGTANHMLWYYPICFGEYIATFNSLYSLQANYQIYYEAGVDSAYNQAGAIGGDFSELKHYILSKLMWDPYSNFTKHMETFTDNYYGKKAGKMIREFIEEYHMVSINKSAYNWVFDKPSIYIRDWDGSKTFLNYYPKFEEAIKEAEGSIYYDNIRVASISCLWMAYMRHMREERMGINFRYKWTNELVLPVNRHQLADEVAAKLKERFEIKLGGYRIRYSDMDNDELFYIFLQREIGHKIDWISNDKMEAAISGFYYGRLGVLKYDGFEYINGEDETFLEPSGIRFLTNYEYSFANIRTREKYRCRTEKIDDDHIRLWDFEVNGRLKDYKKIIKEYYIENDVLYVNITVDEEQRTMASFNFHLHDNLEHLSYRINNKGKWIEHISPSTTPFYAHDINMDGAKFIIFASEASKRGIRLEIPEGMEVEKCSLHIFPRLGNFIIHFISKQGADESRLFSIQPLKDMTRIPKQKYPTGNSTTHYVNMTAELVEIADKNAKFIGKEISVKYSEHCERFHWNKHLLNLSNPHNVYVHVNTTFHTAKNPSDEGFGLIIINKVNGFEFLSIRSMPYKEIRNGTYKWYKFGQVIFTEDGYLTLRPQTTDKYVNSTIIDQIILEDTYEDYELPEYPEPEPEDEDLYDNNEVEDKPKGLGKGAIAGIVIGVIVIIIALTFLGIFINCRVTQYKHEKSELMFSI